ncbi:MAG TPA: cytochrome c biogenesis protein CcdA, partial [Candidatus Sumerlaeota bacterium]|nr:cytochrome c biogenesis protein CcdA [Candidatus Sumerlaeota bacterium]
MGYSSMTRSVLFRIIPALCILMILAATPAALAQVKYHSYPEPEPDGEVVRIIIFSDKTCEECVELKNKTLPELVKKYPGKIATRTYYFNDAPDQVMTLSVRFEDRYGIAEHDPPILFLDGKVRSGFAEEVKPNLEKDILAALEKGGTPWPEPAPRTQRLSDSPTTATQTPGGTYPADTAATATATIAVTTQTPPPPGEYSDTEKEFVTRVTREKLGHLTLLAVIGAGLTDGINPCAFTTIVFLISYLTMIGRNRRDILKTGIVYTTAVFLTYLALGFGMLKIVEGLFTHIKFASKIVYWLTTFVTLCVALLSLRDWRLARQGRFKEMTLKLSEDMQKRIHKVIHERMRGFGMISAALILGALVAMFELPCTGQVYLPIIAAISNPGLRTKALPYLILYNLMFIIPLVLVFVVAYCGVSSKAIGERFKDNVATI